MRFSEKIQISFLFKSDVYSIFPCSVHAFFVRCETIVYVPIMVFSHKNRFSFFCKFVFCFWGDSLLFFQQTKHFAFHKKYFFRCKTTANSLKKNISYRKNANCLTKIRARFCMNSRFTSIGEGQ